ncbi:PIN domain-containing protein [uncultured Methanospirillum sp.]|uniref:PIN domain-containing protein n=1 Tax=uncultured Methanospirillum sp. TaxID=262503 RepID=UPI0029C95E2F|nr:PIN domain-containing protein [uncultured Methanospirillum sp.]
MGSKMVSYLVDTNILIHILAGDIPAGAYSRMNEIYSSGFSISIISKIELLGWRGNTPDGLAVARELIHEAEIISLSDQIADIAITLRQNTSIRLPDAVIAATA